MPHTAPGASAPFRFTPAAQPSAVAHLKITVRTVTHLPDDSLRLLVHCGDIAVDLDLPPLPGRPDYRPGDRLRLEYPKHNNPLTTHFTALYPEPAQMEPRTRAMNPTITTPVTTPVAPTAVTMTSLEMVNYINSQRREGESELRHDHFMAKVPKVLGETAAPNFRGSYIGKDGTARPMYTFPKREACLMAMSYSYDLQAKVFDKMTELEAQLANPTRDPMQVLSDPAAMRGLLLTYTEKVLTLEHQVETLTPKAEALDRIADAEGTMNPTLAAKTLQISPKKLFDFLREKQWIYRRPGGSGNVAYQEKIQAGYLTHRVTTVQREDGTEKVAEQVLVTGKGLAKLAQIFGTSLQGASHV